MAAKTYSAGTIFLQVVPVFGDTMNAIKRQAKDANDAWGKELERGAKEHGEKAGKAAGDAMEREAKKSGERSGTAYAGAFQEKLKGATRGINRELETIEFRTLSDKAGKEFERIKGMAKDLDVEIKPDMDVKKVTAKMEFLKAELKQFLGKHELHIDENIAEVISKVEGGLKVIDKAVDKRRTIEIETRISDRDLGSFERKLKDTAKRAARSLGDSMDPAIRKLKARLDAIGDVEIGIDMNAASARAEIISIHKELSSLPNNVDVDVNTNAAVASAELLAFREVLNAVDGRDIDIPVKLNGAGRAAAEGAALTGILGTLKGAFSAGGESAGSAANSFRSFNFVILAAVTLIPALIPMIGALGGGLLALLPILGAVAGGLGAMIIGFSGIGTAVQAMGAQQDAAAKDSLSASKTMQAAANAVADAERGLADARRAAGQAASDAARAVKDAQEAAARAVEDAMEREKEAQENYRDAVKDVAAAEKDLADARAEARYTLLDLDNKVEQNQIDQGQAVIDVFNAQANFDSTMADGSSTNQDKDAAALALQEAELKLKELRQEQQKLAEEKAKADKKGVDSTDAVQSAQDQLTNALQAQRKAQESLKKASEDVTQAQIDGAKRVRDAERNLARTRAAGARSIADAERNLARARQSAADAAEQTGVLGSASEQALQNAMDKLGPAGKAFATFLFGLRSKFYDLRDAIQEAMLPPIQHAIEKIVTKYGPQIQGFAVSMADSVGGLFTKLGNRMTKSPAWTEFFAMMGRLGPGLLDAFGTTLINFMTGFVSLMTTVAPYSERLSAAMVGISQHFATWMQSGDGISYWQSFMDYAAKVGPEVAAFFGNLWLALVNIGKALAPWGEMVMNAVSGLLAFIGNMDPKTLGTITTAIITLTIAFQVAVGAVALAAAASVTFATVGGTIAFTIVALAGGLWLLYQRYQAVRDAVDGTVKFLKEHRDLLIEIAKYVFGAVAAYKAWKAITAGVKAIQTGYYAAVALSTGAIDANTASTYANTKAGKLGMVAGKAWIAVQRTMAFVTGILTAENLALAASFLLNPITLIVIAIIALIAVFVILFKKNKTFHDLVMKVWGAIKKAAVATWGAITAAFWSGVHAIQDAWSSYLKPVLEAIWTAIKFLWTNVVKPYLTLVWTFWSSIFKAMVWVVVNILFPIIDLIGHVIWKLYSLYFKANLKLIQLAWKVLVFAIRAYWNHYLKPILSALGTAVKWLWEKFVKPNLPKIEAAWGAVSDAVHKAWNKFISPAIEAFKTAMGGLRSKVDTVVGFIQTAWDKMKQIFAAPIVFVVDTILNGGLIAGFNKIADFVGSSNMKDIPLSDDIRNAANGGKAEKHARGGIIGRGNNTYATGGTLPGYTPGQDVHHFTSPTAGSLHLSGGEAIMRPEFTASVGSGWVDKMNMVARAEGKAGIRRMMGGQRFAKGGTWKPFWPEPGGVWSTYPGHDGIDLNAPGDNGPNGDGGVTSFYSATPGTVSYVGYDHGYGNATFISSPVGTLVYGHAYPGSTATRAGQGVAPGTYLGKVGMTGNASGPHLHFGFPGGTPSGALGVLSGAIHGDPHPGGGGGIHVPGWLKDFIKGPMDYVKGLVSKPIHAFKDKFGDNGLVKLMSDIPGKLLGAVKDKAMDIIPGPIKAAAGVVGHVAGAVGDVAGGALDAVGLKTGGVLPYNGTMKYDAGGYLPPGITSVVNMTGKPEPVFTHDQFEDMGGRGGEGFHYEPHYHDSKLTPEDVVRHMDQARRRMRREGRYARSR